jgi:NAD(P)-dependent dehydrogenase (short-subunit alcohol dehydrogenase family)
MNIQPAGAGARDLFRLDGRTAFISGAAGHLGRAMAFGLGHAGAKLVLNGRNAARLEQLRAELLQAGIAAECAAFDMTDIAAVRHWFGGVSQLDVLVNNAVTMTPKAFAAAEPEDFALAYQSAVTAAFEAVRAARPALARAAERGGASVVNIASMYGVVSPDVRLYSRPAQMSPPHYGAAKAALVQLTRHLASELGPEQIRVNVLCPGPFPQPDVVAKDPGFGARLADRTMLRRTAFASEIAGPVLFLASPASSYVTGAVLMADGGWTAW